MRSRHLRSWRARGLAALGAAAILPALGLLAAGVGSGAAAAGGSGSPASPPSTTPPPGPPQDPAAQAVLTLAIQGSRSVNYEGTQTVTVRTQRGIETSVLTVIRRDDDRMVIQAQPGSGPPGLRLVQQGPERAAVGMPGVLAGRGETPPPAQLEPASNARQLLAKYRVLLAGSVQVLARPAWVLRIVDATSARDVERWTVDAVTGLLLARVTYDPAGGVERSMAFTQVQEPYTATDAELTAPPPRAGGGQEWFRGQELGGLARTVGVPASLPGGYELHSGTRFAVDRALVVQLVYSDGLQEVSLFRQPGRLTSASLPPGARAIRLSHGPAFAWDDFPRGTAWQDGPYAYSLVGSSPSNELRQMADVLPQGPLRRSVGQRVRHLMTWLRHLA